MAELDRYQECPFRVSPAGVDPRRGVNEAGSLLWDGLPLRLGRSAFHFSHPLFGTAAFAVIAALGRDHRGDGVLENGLFLVVGCQPHRILVESPDSARQL